MDWKASSVCSMAMKARGSAAMWMMMSGFTRFSVRRRWSLFRVSPWISSILSMKSLSRIRRLGGVTEGSGRRYCLKVSKM